MKKLFIAICLMAGIHTFAHAQLSITPRVAPAFPTGTFENFAGTGFGFGVEGTYTVNDYLRVGAAIDRYQFGFEPFGVNLGNLLNINLVDFKVTPITGTVQYMLPGEILRPYIGLEAGAYYFSIDGNIAGINRTYFGLAPTLGILYPINENMAFFANTKYQTMFVNETIPLVRDFAIRRNIHFIPVSFGLSFKF